MDIAVDPDEGLPAIALATDADEFADTGH